MNKKTVTILLLSLSLTCLISSYLGAEYFSNTEIQNDKLHFQKEIDALFDFKGKLSIGNFNYDIKDFYQDSNNVESAILALSGNKPKEYIDFTNPSLYRSIPNQILKKVEMKAVTNDIFRIKEIKKINDSTRIFNNYHIKEFTYHSDINTVINNKTEFKTLEKLFAEAFFKHFNSNKFNGLSSGDIKINNYLNNLLVMNLSSEKTFINSSKGNFFTFIISKGSFPNKQLFQEQIKLEVPKRILEIKIWNEVYNLKITPNIIEQQSLWKSKFLLILKYVSCTLGVLLLIIVLFKRTITI